MDNQKDIITQTACKKFMQFGIRSVSIEDICAELHISKKKLYQYFPQKEELVDEVIVYFKSKQLEKFEKLHENKNAIDALILTVNEIRKGLESEPHVFMYDLEKYYPAIFEKYKNKQVCNIRDSFEKNLRQGIAEGYYREDMDVELVTLFHSLQMRQTFKEIQIHAPKITKKRLVEFFIDLIIRVITNENGLKYIEKKHEKN